MTSEQMSPDEPEQLGDERSRALFDAGQQASRDGEFLKAYEAYVEAEEAARNVPESARWRLRIRIFQATSLVRLDAYEKAMLLLDGLVSDVETLKSADALNGVDDQFSDELAAVFWSRLVCLDELGRFDEVGPALSALIDQVGSGQTVAQRNWLSGAYLLYAKAAAIGGEYRQANEAIDATLRLCSSFEEEPWVDGRRREAAGTRQNVAAYRSQCRKSRHVLRGLARRRLD